MNLHSLNDLPSENGDAGSCYEQARHPIKATTFGVSYPDPESVKGRVLGALLRGERLTHKDCWIRFGSARLSHHIYMLREANWQIEMDDLNVQTSDGGRVATIGRYFLTGETISEAGERGQRYAELCDRIEARRRAA